MLRLPGVQVVAPTSIDEIVRLLAEHGDSAQILAGGTDLLPNMKHGVATPDVVVGLWSVPDLIGIHDEPDRIEVGARTTLHALGESELVQRYLPSLAKAVRAVAGPQLRRMGTIGGNVCLDTRCVFINQTHFWRRALGYCLKKDGTVCHVVKSGRRCVAAASNDTGPVLMTLGARLKLASHRGAREVDIDDFYIGNGAFNQNRRTDELLTHIVIPKPQPGSRFGYEKLRTRAAIDFPELGVAVRIRFDEGDRLEDVDVCVTALAARPVRVRIDPMTYRGRKLDRSVLEALCGQAFRQCKPLTNLASDPVYRRSMVPVFLRRALRSAEPAEPCESD